MNSICDGQPGEVKWQWRMEKGGRRAEKGQKSGQEKGFDAKMMMHFKKVGM